MYSIQSVTDRSGPRIELTFSRSQLSDANVQRALGSVREGTSRLLCLCAGLPGIALTQYKGDLVRPKRLPGTGSRHMPGCVHFEWQPGGVRLPSGCISGGGDESLLVNLAAFTRIDEHQSGHGSGASSSARYSPPLLSLLWILLVRSGLNVFEPTAHRVDPWLELAHSVRGIRAATATRKNDSLYDHLLLPTQAIQGQASHNQKCLEEAHANRRRLLLATTLRPSPAGLAAGSSRFRSLRTDFGTSVNIEEEVLARALRKYHDARKHSAAGGLVLVLGAAEVSEYARKDGARALSAWVRRLAMISVVPQSLTPTPSSLLRAEFQRCMRSAELYSSTPMDDKNLV